MTRQQIRGGLLLAGVVPALVATLFMAKIAWMLAHDSDGRQRYEAGDYSGAADEFGTNRWTNVFEDWVAPFNEGTARLAAGSLDDARDALTTALETVPADEECTVRINLALAHEELGDELVEFRPEDAAAEWRSGLAALTAGDCLGGGARQEEQQADARSVEKRISRKLPAVEQPRKEPEEREEKERTDPKERKLDQRNARAADEHRDWDAYREGDEEVPGQGW